MKNKFKKSKYEKDNAIQEEVTLALENGNGESTDDLASSPVASESSINSSEEKKVHIIENNIGISKDLMDGKGIDVINVEQDNKLTEDGKIEIKTTISTKNYDEAVVKLINEVKIFSDDESDLKINTKRSIWPFILICLILSAAAGVAYYYLYVYEKNETHVNEEKNDNSIVSYRYEQNIHGIDFYGNGDLISTYECELCSPYSLGEYEYFSTSPTVMAIQEKDSVFLYDYTLNQIIGDNYTKLQNLNDSGKTVAFIVSNDSGLFGIIDIEGNVLVPIEYEELGYSLKNGVVSDYSYSKDIITAKKDGYWGAINFKGEEVIPFEYEDIYYNGYDSIVVEVEGLWYLNGLDNSRLIESGYDVLIPINSYAFASVNNVFYILNYRGESIISEEIPTYLDSFRSRDNVLTPAFKIEEDGTMVNIYIMNLENTYSQYRFNTVNGELNAIIQ